MAGLEAHERRLGGLVGGRKLYQQLAVVAQESRDPREQARRGAPDPDVAVEQQRGAPAAAAGELVEDRRDDRPHSAPGRELDGSRRQVHAQGEHSAGGEFVQVTAGPAANIEDRAAYARQQLLIGLIGRAEIAIERQRQRRAILGPQEGVARAPQAGGVHAQRMDHAAIAPSAAANRVPPASLATARASSIVSMSRSRG